MSAQSMLEQLLRQGMAMLQNGSQGRTAAPAPWQGQPSEGRTASGQPGQGAARGPGLDWGSFGAGAASGAAVTGALGLLLGQKKAGRYAGKAMKYGGVAAIGLMAYKAYQQWQAGQARPASAGPAADTAPAALPAPRTVDRIGPDEAERHSRAMLAAMIGAAKADGHLDERERGLLDAELGRLAADAALRDWMHTELQRPLDPAATARLAETPELAAEMYLASLLVADEQSFMERAYLDELARQLKLDPGLKTQLEAQAHAA